MVDMGQIAKSDAELVEASRRGERDAFGQLVSRYQDVVCAVSYSSTGNWALSEDVAQDTFIAAWRQLGQLRETGRLRSWLCGIARNLARKARQKSDRETEVDDSLPAPDRDPFDATAQAEVDRVVREALARIPDTYRETLVLYYCENRSVRDVATTLGIAEDAAMQRLSRGRRYLAEGVNELVERSLRSTRGRKDISAAVVAALPHVEPVPVSEGSTMWKIAIAALVVAAVGTTTVVAVTRNSDDARPAAASTNSAASQTPAAAAAPAAAPAHRAAAAPSMPKLMQKPSFGDEPETPRIVSKADRDRLKIEEGPSKGPANAPVTIVVYQDVLCPYCGRVLGTIDELMDEYPGKIRLVVKQFPVHKEARLAAEAAFAADAQGKFWELHDQMFANSEDLSRDAIVGYAKQAGLDEKKIAKALDEHTYYDQLKADVNAAQEIGVNATPQFFINGFEIRGAVPIENMREAINEALAAKP